VGTTIIASLSGKLMKISVVIPVYNAEKFVQRAVASALEQSETAEILLVEDASPDKALDICQKLEEKHIKVRLLQHKDLKNHGAGASRNLGIKNAKFDYVAFLDADDFYLKNRFVRAIELFKQNPDIDGVYEPVGSEFLSVEGKTKWFLKGNKKSVTMLETESSKQLFESLLTSGKGTVHLNGLTVKKKIIEDCGYFFEHLKLHQDTALIVQMSVLGTLIPGRLKEPVAVRTIHDQNRILNQRDQRYNKYLYWMTLFNWANENCLPPRRQAALFQKYIVSMYSLAKNNPLLFPRSFHGLKPLWVEPFSHPFLFLMAVLKRLSDRFRG
jgi:glycosyltransferase involved in cell wall biosynthesis